MPNYYRAYSQYRRSGLQSHILVILAVVAALNVLNISGVSVAIWWIRYLFTFQILLLLWLYWLDSCSTGASRDHQCRTQLDDKLSSEVGVGGIISVKFFTGLYYYFSFLLFLGINRFTYSCSKHGEWGDLPNIFIAGVIVFVGYILVCVVLLKV